MAFRSKAYDTSESLPGVVEWHHWRCEERRRHSGVSKEYTDVAGLASHFKKIYHCCGLRQCHGAVKVEFVKLQPELLVQF